MESSRSSWNRSLEVCVVQYRVLVHNALYDIMSCNSAIHKEKMVFYACIMLY